ncbi:MAG TPA: ATP-binding protein [Gemmatimonadales bacterium]
MRRLMINLKHLVARVVGTWGPTCRANAGSIVAAVAFLVPLIHPLFRPVLGPPSHLTWFAHVLAVALVGYHGGAARGAGALVASMVMVAAGEGFAGQGYWVGADAITVIALTTAVGTVDLLVLAFAVWVRGAEARRRELSAVAIAALEGAPDAVLLLNADRRVTMANAVAARLLGTGVETIHGRLIDELTGVDVLAPRTRGEPGVMTRNDGTAFPAEWKATPVGAVDGAPDAWLVAIEDCTKRVQQEHASRRTSALAEMGQVIAGIAHELNNPLTGMLGYAELLAVESSLSPSDREMIDALVHEARRAGGIARRLLQLVRRREPTRRSLDLAGLVNTALKIRLSGLVGHGIRLHRRIAADLPAVFADPDEIEQILVVLLVNAQQAMVEVRGGGELTVTLRRHGEMVELRVADDGPGVPPEQRDAIFEPFFTTKAATVGTGLGLPLARRIARAHGGDLLLESNRPGGAVFVLQLPLASAVPAVLPVPDRAVSGDQTIPRQGRRVLVVDDEPAIRDTVRRLLERSGFAVEVCATAAGAARTILADHHDVIICDMRLGSESGSVMYRSVVRSRADLRGRFLFMTGDTLSADVERFLSEAGEQWIAKPFELRELVRAVTAIAA